MYICPKNNDEVISNKNEFISILRNDVHRRGRENFIAWLERTDFFTAPASTRFHEAYPGGLCEHSLVVRQKLVALNEAAPTEYKLTDEQVTLVALGHDVCKSVTRSQLKRLGAILTEC